MRRIVNNIVKQYLKFRYRRIHRMREAPYRAQGQWLTKLTQMAKNTDYGKRYGFASIRSYEEFARQVPIVDYEEIKPEIRKMMMGEKDILWPGYVKWYSKSSGTTSDKSKYIPVPSQNLRQCHIQGSWDSMSVLYHHRPDAQSFAKKSLIMGGSVSRFDPYPKTRTGDVSAVMLYNMPVLGRPFYTPDFETALLDDWEEKIERMTNITKEEDVVMIGGVPTWTVVLINRILEKTGKDHMLEVWPNAMAYLHGGVGFDPYKEQFKKYFPDPNFVYQEIYNASEGFIGIQDDHAINSLLLLTDNAMFFEFEDMHSGEVVPLEGVKTGVNYSLIMSTNSGLWRYRIGDTVMFDSILPHRFKITGRTQQYINVFGEEVMIANTDKALAQTCRELGAKAEEYTVAPIFLDDQDKGGHEWVVEFEEMPSNLKEFAARLDKNLQKLNSDYEAKRSYDLALEQLQLTTVAPGTFHNWMRSRGKYGGQNKVPRLSNTRKYIDQLLVYVTSDRS